MNTEYAACIKVGTCEDGTFPSPMAPVLMLMQDGCNWSAMHAAWLHLGGRRTTVNGTYGLFGRLSTEKWGRKKTRPAK